MKRLMSMLIAGTMAAVALPVSAQRAAPQTTGSRPRSDQRYEIAQMERVLEGAVEHGLTVTRERVEAVAQMPADMLVSDNAHARGFRLDGYGVFFDVLVPSFETTWTWSLRTLDQNDLGLDSALRTLQTHIRTAGDPSLEQALKRLELQMNPALLARASVADAGGARNATGASAVAGADGRPRADEAVLADPNEAYRAEVTQALKDAMLAHSSALGIGATEWLTIAARGSDDRPRLAPADAGSGTRILRLRGSDLAEFLAGKITREDALQRIDVRMF